MENSSRDGNNQTTLPAYWETCMQVKKQQLELDMEQQTGSKLGKEYIKAVYCHPVYLTYYAEYIMQNARLDEAQAEAQAGIKTARRNSNNLRNADDTTLMTESKEELKSLLMKVKEESEKVGWKLNIQKEIMASSPITSWQIDWETATNFIFLGSTADGGCSHEIKRHLFLGRKAMKNLDSILKTIDITLPTKVHIVKAMVFPGVMYRCERWTVKKVDHWRIDVFELLCCRRLFRVPWTARRSNQSKRNQSWIFIGRTDTEAETPILRPPDVKSQLIWKDPDAWKDWGQEEKGTIEDEMIEWHHWVKGYEFKQTLGDCEGKRSLVCCSPWGHKELDTT